MSDSEVWKVAASIAIITSLVVSYLVGNMRGETYGRTHASCSDYGVVVHYYLGDRSMPANTEPWMRSIVHMLHEYGGYAFVDGCERRERTINAPQPEPRSLENNNDA